MSAGDAVCTGWLVKSPPERKLQRYVSRGVAARPRGPGWPRGGLGVAREPRARAAGEAGGRKARPHVEPERAEPTGGRRVGRARAPVSVRERPPGPPERAALSPCRGGGEGRGARDAPPARGRRGGSAFPRGCEHRLPAEVPSDTTVRSLPRVVASQLLLSADTALFENLREPWTFARMRQGALGRAHLKCTSHSSNIHYVHPRLRDKVFTTYSCSDPFLH